MTGTTKKRILFIMQLPPPVHGVSVMNQIIRQSALVNESLHCDYINLATAKDINDLRKKRIGKYLQTFRIVLKAVYQLATRRYDYVYITIFPFGAAFYKDSLFVLLSRLFRQKPLLHLHTFGFRESAEKTRFRKKYYTFVFKNTEVICLSKLLTADVEPLYKGRFHILPNGIPQVNFDNTYTLRPESEPLSILYLSNLIRGKGILLLLEALRALHQKGQRIHLRVVGSEGDVTYSELEAFVSKHQLGDVVTLVGPKFGEAKYEEFRMADLFVLPSNYDTFGLVLLEAMQFGVPCIASSIGGIPDVIGNGRGVLLSGINAEAVETAITTLINDPALRLRISKAGFDYYTQHFTTAVFERRLTELLSTGNISITHEP